MSLSVHGRLATNVEKGEMSEAMVRVAHVAKLQ